MDCEEIGKRLYQDSSSFLFVRHFLEIFFEENISDTL